MIKTAIFLTTTLFINQAIATSSDLDIGLLSAAHKCDSNMTAFFLEKGADPNAVIHKKDIAGMTASISSPLLEAVKGLNGFKAKKCLPVAEKLLEAGASPNLQGNGLISPILYLARTSKEKADFDLLINSGGDINLQDKSSASSQKDTFLMLLDRGELGGKIKVLEGNKFGQKKRQKYLDMYQKFASKADLNLQNKNGDTALIQAARRVQCSIVEILVNTGANTKIKNNDGKTAKDFAYQSADPKCIAVLTEN